MDKLDAIFDPYTRENVYRIFAYILIIWWFNLDILCGLIYIILVFTFDVSILNASITFLGSWFLKCIIKTKFSHLIKLPGKQLYDPIFGNQPIFKSRQVYDDWRENYKNYGTIYRYDVSVFFQAIHNYSCSISAFKQIDHLKSINQINFFITAITITSVYHGLTCQILK